MKHGKYNKENSMERDRQTTGREERKNRRFERKPAGMNGRTNGGRMKEGKPLPFVPPKSVHLHAFTSPSLLSLSAWASFYRIPPSSLFARTTVTSLSLSLSRAPPFPFLCITPDEAEEEEEVGEGEEGPPPAPNPSNAAADSSKRPHDPVALRISSSTGGGVEEGFSEEEATAAITSSSLLTGTPLSASPLAPAAAASPV
mmetsp:Transcript_14246/g.28595  ORF Transcript_14246/g.28595 Transcript_14246/m.28595 type:complete len:200 (-) Transcript_14246:2323-2922(-)